MGGQAAEQIIAGVVLSERLAVTMYGAIHRAQFEGQRNQRGLVVDPRMLAEASFRIALTDGKTVHSVTELEHPNIVPTVTVEDGGPDVVVVTRGVGRYVTVQDLITSAKANRAQGGKLPLPVAAAIGKSVVEALATAHKAKVVHGAVHPRSVLVDEDGTVRLADFIVGRALTTAVAQGADSALWRGLAGYLAPELVVGEEPTPAADVFACGAMLFTMLSGEAPPGTLHVTPAVERLVQRALDTDVTRRYKNASDLLENLLEAFEDDRWEIATRGEVIKAAGLTRAGSESGLDDATEDLLASLGNSAVNVTPMRPSMDSRAAEINARHTKTPTSSNRLDALLADLDDSREHTSVDDIGFKRDPISELIQMDPRKKEAIVQVKPVRSSSRVPSLDDPDEDTPLPLPLPARDSETDVRTPRPNSRDESAAMDALAGLDEPVRRMSSAAEQATVAAEKLESAARRAEAAAKRVDSEDGRVVRPSPAPAAAAPRAVANLPEIPQMDDLPPPRLKSRALGIISMLVVIGGAVAFYYVYQDQKAKTAEQKKREEQAKLDAEAESKRRQNALKDKGSISYKIEPPEARPASVWLKLGRSGPDFQTIPLTSSQMHRIRIELDGYQSVDTEVLAANWSAPEAPMAGSGSAVAPAASRKATVNITLKAAGKSKDGKSLAEPLPARPPNLAVEPTGFVPGEGPINIQTNPPGAEVWLLIGYGDTGMPFPTIAGRSYELRALMDGFKPGYASITDEEWRDGGNPNIPIDEAPKKATLEKTITLVPDPDWVDPKDKKPKKGK
ncbi:MAG: protein kinase [Kofleriaceae bacterium]